MNTKPNKRHSEQTKHAYKPSIHHSEYERPQTTKAFKPNKMSPSPKISNCETLLETGLMSGIRSPWRNSPKPTTTTIKKDLFGETLMQRTKLSRKSEHHAARSTLDSNKKQTSPKLKTQKDNTYFATANAKMLKQMTNFDA